MVTRCISSIDAVAVKEFAFQWRAVPLWISPPILQCGFGAAQQHLVSIAPMRLEIRRLRDVLEANGYRVTYPEFVGGHNEVCWRGSFADAIMALTAEGKE